MGSTILTLYERMPRRSPAHHLVERDGVPTDSNRRERVRPENRGDELPEDLREHVDRLNRLREAKERLDAEEQQLKEEQAEKIRKRDREEEEMWRKKRGRKPTPPEEVELLDDTKANTPPIRGGRRLLPQ